MSHEDFWPLDEEKYNLYNFSFAQKLTTLQ